MKYCMLGRQPKSILKQADEIKMYYSDKDRIIDYIEDFPDKTIILEVPKDIENLNWTLFEMYAKRINFVLCLANLDLIPKCQEHGIKFYWMYPVSTYMELWALANLYPEYVLLDGPLCFDLPKVKQMTSAKIRMCPNLADVGYIPKENGLRGPWIRPEDVDLYGDYVYVFEFYATELSREAVLLHIYKDNKNWPGDLNLLITNLNYNINNQLLPKEWGEVRRDCGQRCMEYGSCHFCLRNAIQARPAQSSSTQPAGRI